MRKLGNLLDHLPPESATMTALRNEGGLQGEKELVRGNPARAPWSALEMLIATLIDEVRGLRSAYSTVHTGTVIQPPKPIPRPGIQVAEEKQRTAHMNDAQRALLDEQRKRLSPPPLRRAGEDA